MQIEFFHSGLTAFLVKPQEYQPFCWFSNLVYLCANYLTTSHSSLFLTVMLWLFNNNIDMQVLDYWRFCCFFSLGDLDNDSKWLEASGGAVRVMFFDFPSTLGESVLTVSSADTHTPIFISCGLLVGTYKIQLQLEVGMPRSASFSISLPGRMVLKAEL